MKAARCLLTQHILLQIINPLKFIYTSMRCSVRRGWIAHSNYPGKPSHSCGFHCTGLAPTGS